MKPCQQELSGCFKPIRIKTATPVYTNEAFSADVIFFLTQEQHSQNCILKDTEQSFTNTNQISLALIKFDLKSGEEW